MIECIAAQILCGYTGYDHLISSDDLEAIEKAVIGREFRSTRDVRKAAQRAYAESCDKRVLWARMRLTLKLANGRQITVLA